MVSGWQNSALDLGLCNDHDHCHAADLRLGRGSDARCDAQRAGAHPSIGGCRTQRPEDRCAGDHRASRSRNHRHGDADAQLVARCEDHGDFRTIAPSVARLERHGFATADACSPVRRHRAVLLRRSACDSGADRHCRPDDRICAGGFCGAAHADCRAEEPILLAQLQLPDRGGVRLAYPGDGRARIGRCRFRAAQAISARAVTALPHPESLNSSP